MSETITLVRRRGRRKSDAERDRLIQERIFQAAIGLTQRSGFAALTCQNLADLLHIRCCSLLKLTEGIERLRDKVALLAIKELTELTAAAVRDRTGRGAIEALVDAQRLFAQAQPGMYEASQMGPACGSLEVCKAVEALRTIDLEVIRSYGVPPQRCAQLAWCMHAMVLGAIRFEAIDKFTKSDEIDQRFDQLIDILDANAKLAAAPRARAFSSVV